MNLESLYILPIFLHLEQSGKLYSWNLNLNIKLGTSTFPFGSRGCLFASTYNVSIDDVLKDPVYVFYAFLAYEVKLFESSRGSCVVQLAISL